MIFGTIFYRDWEQAVTRQTYTHLTINDRLLPAYLEHLYLNNDIAARICELVSFEMLRQGVTIKVNDEDFRWDGFNEILHDVLVKSRIFGAAFIYFGVDDGFAQEQPLSFFA